MHNRDQIVILSTVSVPVLFKVYTHLAQIYVCHDVLGELTNENLKTLLRQAILWSSHCLWDFKTWKHLIFFFVWHLLSPCIRGQKWARVCIKVCVCVCVRENVLDWCINSSYCRSLRSSYWLNMCSKEPETPAGICYICSLLATNISILWYPWTKGGGWVAFVPPFFPCHLGFWVCLKDWTWWVWTEWTTVGGLVLFYLAI